MKNIIFKVYHPSLELISDRTFRSLLKKLSSVVREIQITEVYYLINQISQNELLSPSEKQSLRDRLDGPLRHIDSYYVEEIERGSLKVTVTATAIALWLLNTALSETVKEVWVKSEINKQLVTYLTTEKREEIVERNCDVVIESWNFEGFSVENVEKELVEGETLVITINIGTARSLKNDIKKIDVDFIIQELNKEIEEQSKSK